MTSIARRQSTRRASALGREAILAMLFDIRPSGARGGSGRRTSAGADRWLFGGEFVVFGGWPAETVAWLRQLPVREVADGAAWGEVIATGSSAPRHERCVFRLLPNRTER